MLFQTQPFCIPIIIRTKLITSSWILSQIEKQKLKHGFRPARILAKSPCYAFALLLSLSNCILCPKKQSVSPKRWHKAGFFVPKAFVCLANVPDLVRWVTLYGEQLLVCINCRNGQFVLSSLQCRHLSS